MGMSLHLQSISYNTHSEKYCYKKTDALTPAE